MKTKRLTAKTTVPAEAWPIGMTKVDQCGDRPKKAFGPFLADEIARRKGCRQNLEGLRVETSDRTVFKILATAIVWGPHNRLIVNLDDGTDGGLWLPVDNVRMVDPWPVTCCHRDEEAHWRPV